MLHLSLITLPRSAPRWRLLDAYGLHQVLWNGFPELKVMINALPPSPARESVRQDQRFLYRYDELNDDDHKEYLSVLVQSVTEPNWSFLDNEAEGTTARMLTFDPMKITEGTELRFFIRANPVASRKGYDDRPSRRIVIGARRDYIASKLKVDKDQLLSREALLLEWLEKKGSVYETKDRPSIGFELVRDAERGVLCTISPNHDYLLRCSNVGGIKNRITLTTVDFTGILRVTDPAAFANTLRRGIGRGRAFGCGLLSVRRA